MKQSHFVAVLCLIACAAFCAFTAWSNSIGEIGCLIAGHNDEVSLWLKDVVKYVYILAIAAFVIGVIIGGGVAKLYYADEEEEKEDDIAGKFKDDDKEEKEMVIRVRSDGNIRLFVDDDEIVDDETEDDE